jgi:UDP-N-acetylglucosamine 2-epimerase
MIGDLIDKLREADYDIIALDQTTTEGEDIGSMIEKTLHEPNTWLPVEAYLTIGAILKVIDTRKTLEKIWKDLESNPKFIEALGYDDKTVAEQLKRDFRLCFRLHLPKDILYLEMMKTAIKKEKPDLILITCEYASFGLAATIAGRLMKVPTLAVQHGLITRYDRGYIYAKENISPDGSVETPYHPIPNETAVYGQYYKSILTDVGAYPEDSIVVTGQPRYDILADPAKLFDREKMLKDLGLDPNKKMVLWTTQSHGLTAKENKRTFAAVYNTLKELSDSAQLIVKLHPAEKDDQHKAAAKEIGFHPVITKNANIYELLYACDLLITKHSSTAIEAAALNKPVIILNLGEEPDIVDYAKNGIAAGVYAEKDLQPTIKKLLEDDSNLASSRKKYLEKHLYRIDGKAGERVIELIDKMIER